MEFLLFFYGFHSRLETSDLDIKNGVIIIVYHFKEVFLKDGECIVNYRCRRMRFADVIVPLAVDGVFTYSVPAALEDRVREGVPVLVPFAGSKMYTGIVCRLHEQEPTAYKTKPVEGIAEEGICLPPEQLKFLLWLSDYYMAMPGEVVKAALPVAFRLESFTCIRLTAEGKEEAEVLTENERALLSFLRPGEFVSLQEAGKCLKVRSCVPIVKGLLQKGLVEIKETIDDLFREKCERWIRWARVFSDEELNEVLDGLHRAPVQYRLLCRWIEFGVSEMEKGAFLEGAGASTAILKILCDKKILVEEERVVSRLEQTGDESGNGNSLSERQAESLLSIRREFAQKECVLLQGVTSSGKTEVYIHLMKEYMEKGRQVLYMLPEIALTVQIVKRLRRVFGDMIGVYHSGMSDSVRAEMWKRQCSDEPYRLILGVRSSVFLPFKDLGLIIVDEEHETSYKQREPSPRYNGRDGAIMLGKFYGAKVLLGSATPSFETYHNALAGKYGFVRLDNRYGDVQMPELLFADVGEYRRKKLMTGSFSPVLIEEMKRVLDAGNQVILFQNRRGYSTYLQCDKCGAIPRCNNCDVSLTYYKQRNVLNCHYCGSLRSVSDVCASCGVGHYRQRTPGTERIEEEVATLFPDSRVARMDMEVMTSKAKYQAVIDDFEQGRTNVLIGTQMVSKGLDFEHVKLVGVMDADSMVHFPDFRAEERAYCMLTQVSGRSGRKGEQGKVVIQMANRDNRVYEMLKNGGYDQFFNEQSEERKLFGYPPFGRIIQLELRHQDVIRLRNASNVLAGRLRELLGRRVCGPAVPEIGKIGGQNRVQFILKIEHGASFSKIKAMLKKEFAALRAEKEYGSLRVICDVDP